MSDTPIPRVRSLSEPPAAPEAPQPEAAPSPAAAPPHSAAFAAPPAGPPPKPAPAPAPPASPAFAAPPAGARPADRPAQPTPVRPRFGDIKGRDEDDGPRARNEQDIDRALDAAARRGEDRPKAPEVALKRQWDDELEAELEDAMAGFDASAFDVQNAGARRRAADRAHAEKSEVGTEGSSGTRKGKVIGVRGKSVFIDLAAKSEGVVPVEQFGENPLPNAGDIIDVVVDRFDHEEGLLILSLKGAAVEADWTNLRKGLIVEARPTKVNKGGLEVVIDGIRGFLPLGQLDINRIEDPSIFLNQKLRVIVTEANQREKNLVVSRRELLEREREEMKAITWQTLEEGQVRSGVVRSVKDFGAFVDIGGVDGLIHISDLAWSRVDDVSKIVRVGDKVEVKILKIDKTTSKVGLGLKQLTPSPWDTIEDRIGRGDTVKGKVTRLMPGLGAFVELEPGIEGLVHITELGPKRVFRIHDYVKEGQEVDVRVLKIEPEVKRISLSLKPLPAATVEPEDEPEDDAPAAPKVERKVPLKGGLGDTDPNPFGKPPR